MKAIHYFETAKLGKYRLYAEVEPMIIAGKSTRYLKLYRVDTIVPFEVANIIQTYEDYKFSYKCELLHQSEKVALEGAINWLQNEWRGKL